MGTAERPKQQMKDEKRRAVVGIDIGKTSIHLCSPQLGKSPNQWDVIQIDLTEPNWWVQLLDFAPSGSVVAFEPTGYHLSAPIVTVLTQMGQAEIWYVGHGTTGRVREVHVSIAKTDAMDARALAMVAEWINNGSPPANTRRHDLVREQEVQALRTLVNNRGRLLKTTTRLQNRLHAYAHAMFPAVDRKFTTWLPLASAGVISPAQIKAYVKSFPPETDHRRITHIKRLADALPEIDVSPFVVETIRNTAGELDYIQVEIQRLEGQIRSIVLAPPFGEITRRVMTIPGAGKDPVRIAPFHVAAHGLLDSLTPDEFKACIGISAKTSQSGSIDNTRAMKGGYQPAANELFLWTMRMLSGKVGSNPVEEYNERIKRRGKAKPFRATRAKLAMLISGVARSPGGYNPAGRVKNIPSLIPLLLTNCPNCGEELWMNLRHDQIYATCYTCRKHYDPETLEIQVIDEPEFDHASDRDRQNATLRELGLIDEEGNLYTADDYDAENDDVE